MDEVFDINQRLNSSISEFYKRYIESIVGSARSSNKTVGALVLEPIFIGAGGFKLVDVLFQNLLVEFCKKEGVPVIFDEVAVGMYRIGPSSTLRMVKQVPDIAVYGKLVTGGYLPLSVTLTAEETFEAFVSDEKSKALLHGHSYTANPVSCTAALEALRCYKSSERYDAGEDWMQGTFQEAAAATISLMPGVESAVCLGSILTVDLAPVVDVTGISLSPSPAIRVVERLRECGVYARPLGDSVYIMTSQFTTLQSTERIMNALMQSILQINWGHRDMKSWKCDGVAAV